MPQVLKMELVSWGGTPSYMDLVNQRCALRAPIDTRSNLNNRDKQTVRSYKVLDSEGNIVGGFTLRCNCWYLAEVKYIMADDPVVLDFVVAYALKLAKRPVYHVTVAKKEEDLRKALKKAGFEAPLNFTYKDREVGLWVKEVKQKLEGAERLDLLPEEEAAALIEAPKGYRLEGGKKAKVLTVLAGGEFKPNDDTTWTPPRMYPDEKRKTAKVHKHGDMGWHPISKAHRAQA